MLFDVGAPLDYSAFGQSRQDTMKLSIAMTLQPVHRTRLGLGPTDFTMRSRNLDMNLAHIESTLVKTQKDALIVLCPTTF